MCVSVIHKLTNVSVTEMKLEADQEVSKPINHGGSRANTLHKLFLTTRQGEAEEQSQLRGSSFLHNAHSSFTTEVMQYM